MRLYELVNRYHIGTKLSCAEAMFKACSEYFHLELGEDARKMFSVMGLGMQSEMSSCGAFTVAVGVIGFMTAQEGQTDYDNIEGYHMICELIERVDKKFGTRICSELKQQKFKNFKDPCDFVVEEISRKLELVIQRRSKIKSLNGVWKNMPELTAMQNIGGEMARKLTAAGIDTPEKLRELGSKQAFCRLKAIFPNICLVHLYVLEGAVTNQEYNRLPEETKQELKAFINEFTSNP